LGISRNQDRAVALHWPNGRHFFRCTKLAIYLRNSKPEFWRPRQRHDALVGTVFTRWSIRGRQSALCRGHYRRLRSRGALVVADLWENRISCGGCSVGILPVVAHARDYEITSRGEAADERIV